MTNHQRLKSVSERDIDLSLLEELVSSPDFSRWFTSQVDDLGQFGAFIDCLHSVSDPALGETDIQLVYEDAEGRRCALLIENKISAPPQPEQANRYRLRGERGCEQGDWDRYLTCLVAPQKYLDLRKESEVYDAELSYERVESYFENLADPDRRFAHKAYMVRNAIEQNRRGYDIVVDHRLTAFVADYAAYCDQYFPDLHMTPAKPRGSQSTWIQFFDTALPQGSDLQHQLRAGMVKLFFRGQADELERLRDQYGNDCPDGYAIETAGKSVSLAAKVPIMDDRENQDFQASAEAANVALGKIRELLAYLAEKTSGVA